MHLIIADKQEKNGNLLVIFMLFYVSIGGREDNGGQALQFRE
jgi:hypothetical protein